MVTQPAASFPEPVVGVTPRSLQEAAREVIDHPSIETAWGNYGLIFDDDSVIVVGTILPDDGDIRRHFATTTFGGPQAAAEINWLQANWALMHQHGLTPQGAQLGMLYKGHSHHGLGVDDYSSTDRRSIVQAVRDGLRVAVGPLATCDAPGPRIKRLSGKRGFGVRRTWWVDIKYYYYSQRMLEAGITEPIVVQPKLIQTKDLPLMPPQGWHFARPTEFETEQRLLESYGCGVSVSHLDAIPGPPYELRFTVTRSNWRGIVIITTAADYPITPPVFDVAVIDKNRPPSLHFSMAPAPAGPVWQPGMTFLEAIFRLEGSGRL